MPGKTWTVYLIFNTKTERSYVGVTSLDPPFLRLEGHARKETNAELFMDLRIDAERVSFLFFELAHFDNEEDGYRAEQSIITALIHIVGPYGLYNRRAGGKPSYYGPPGTRPPLIRESLLARTKEEMRKRTLAFRGGRKRERKQTRKAWHNREAKKAKQKKKKNAITTPRAPRVKQPRPVRPAPARPVWMSDPTLLPKRPPIAFVKPGVVRRDPSKEKSERSDFESS